ncbi:uncharacterized protein VTP21DRAFT_9802 [Calcarisporiella thermophila]|uniref:uncharacterized protein n=1 Tax=Calcarisporiella thermophila TaxID=911321 RepID=UPI00374344FB
MPLLLKYLKLLLVLLGIISGVILSYLYNYTLFCGWKWKDTGFRLVLLADPQMEGDAKIYRQGMRGRLDLAFNDLYFRHIHLSLQRLRPTHTIVLGDLFSSQWIDDDEFRRRVERYQRAFSGVKSLVGNHDVGYGADMSRARLERWEQAFGPTEFQFEESLGEGKIVRVVGFNSMALDGPAMDEEIRAEAWRFLEEMAEKRKLEEQEGKNVELILLTHVPLYKKEGLCVDAPLTWRDSNNFIIEQNMLSANASDFLLRHLKPTIIFAGHDHAGCDIAHVLSSNSTDAFPTGAISSEHGVREVTVRSVMAEFGGSAGLFEMKSDGSWNYAKCEFVTDRVVWIALALNGISVGGSLFIMLLETLVRECRNRGTAKTRVKKKLA